MDTNTLFATLGIVATNVITVITLYIHLDNKTEKTLDAIHAEIKDFHERLIRIEEARK